MASAVLRTAVRRLRLAISQAMSESWQAPTRRPGAWALAWWQSRARPVPIALAIAGLLALRHASAQAVGFSSETAIATAFARRGLTCEAADVAWVSRPHGVWNSMTTKARALVRAHSRGDPKDLYLVDARL